MESTRTDFIHFAKVGSAGFLCVKFEGEEGEVGGWDGAGGSRVIQGQLSLPITFTAGNTDGNTFITLSWKRQNLVFDISL